MENMLDVLMHGLGEHANKVDLDMIKKGYDIAYKAHNGQIRKSGEAYMIHPVQVAIILSNYGMDTETIVAGLLHDVLEDTDLTLDEIIETFGSEISHLVNGVTKISKIPYITREEHKIENIRKMIIAMAQDIRVIIIKLADRLHNMLTIEYLKDQNRRDKALETIEIYAPLAHRLGIKAMKDQLEDLSLRQLDIFAYRDIEEFLKIKKEEREKIVEQIKLIIKQRLNYEDHQAHVEGRAKNVYSVYKKVYQHGYSFEEIYDVYAVRIIVDIDNECYYMLGIIHDMFKPLPNRFKDYISTPKPNMYQSLHTTVINEKGIIFEVQIRTWEMHYTAEYGIAAHWKYKAGIKTGSIDPMEKKLKWVRKLLETQSEAIDFDDIIDSIKYDLTSEEIYFFTPKGDVRNLPLGSTIIDFAYSIHSEIGDKLIGAKVDGKIVPITYKIQTGQVVQVLINNSKDQGPSRDWIKIVKTSQARNKIKGWFRREKREENIINGKQDFDKELHKSLIYLTDKEYNEFVNLITRKYHYNAPEEFYAALGYGGLKLTKIIHFIKELYNRKFKKTVNEITNFNEYTNNEENKNLKEKIDTGVIIEDIDDCLIKFSQCCSPLPGDEIIGFVTRGYGVSIHKEDCKNVANMKNNESYNDRWIKARWPNNNISRMFRCNIEIITNKKQGISSEITLTIANAKVPIYNFNIKENNIDLSIKAVIGVDDIKKLESLISKIYKIKGVISVTR